MDKTNGLLLSIGVLLASAAQSAGGAVMKTWLLSLIKREVFRLYYRNRISQTTYLRIVKRLKLGGVSLVHCAP